MTARRSAIERELKLSVWPEFQMPDLARAMKGGRLGAAVARRLDATYYDTPDLRLLRQGITLRLRRGEGDGATWTLKLPGDAQSLGLSRREISMPGRPGPVPHELGDVARPWALGARLAPVARMITERRSVGVLDANGAAVASIDDDDVVVMRSGRVVARFRELEVELHPDAPVKVLSALAKRLTAGGAQPAPQVPKLVHALGPDATEPPLLSPGKLGAPPGAEAALRHHLAAELRDGLAPALAAVALGEPDAAQAARSSARRLAALLRAYGPVLDTGVVDSACAELERLDALLAPATVIARVRALLEHPPPAAGLDTRGRRAWADALTAEHEQAHGRLLRGMRAHRHRDLLATLAAIAATPPFKPRSARRRPAADVARTCTRRALRDLREQLPAEPAADAVAGALPGIGRLAAAAQTAGPGAEQAADDVARLRDTATAGAERVETARLLRRIAPRDGAWAAGVLAGMQLQQAHDLYETATDAWRTTSRKGRWSRLD